MSFTEKTYGQRLIEAAKQASEIAKNGGITKPSVVNYDKVLLSLVKRVEKPVDRMRRIKGSIDDAGTLNNFIKRWYSKDKIVCLPSMIKVMPYRGRQKHHKGTDVLKSLSTGHR